MRILMGESPDRSDLDGSTPKYYIDAIVARAA
jgi:hypothetical protein